MAELSEHDIGLVKAGSVAQISITAYPDRHFKGKVDFIYPTLDAATRTVQVRVELANPDGLLKPAMFANVELAVSHRGKVLTVPVSAVIDSGTRKIVLVQLAEGRFEPRTVKLGSRGENHVEVLEGLGEGDQVPAWVHALGIAVVETAREHPEIQSESCASPRHEALEAMRWARALLASGQAKPEEIAIAAASPAEWDDHFQALSEMAGIDLHFGASGQA